MEEELLRDKDIIWQCVSCNKCTYACPRDVNPEGVMKATAHWLELKGHTEKKPSMVFDEVFSDQVFATGKIEEGRVHAPVLRRAPASRCSRTGCWRWCAGWSRRLPVGLMMKLGVARLFRPRTRGWRPRAAAIAELCRRAPGRASAARLALPPRKGRSDDGQVQARSPTIPGCALEGTGHAYDRSTRAVGKALGLDLVELKNWNCCGAMEVKNIDPKLQTYLSARNLVDRGGDGLRDRDGAVQRLLPQPQEGRIRPDASTPDSREVVDRLSQKAGHAAYEAGTVDDHPRARLDQAGDRRGRPAPAVSGIRSRASRSPTTTAACIPGRATSSRRRTRGRAAESTSKPHFMDDLLAAAGADVRRLSAQDRLLRRRAYAVRFRHLDQARPQSADDRRGLRRRGDRHRMPDLPYRAGDAPGPRGKGASASRRG